MSSANTLEHDYGINTGNRFMDLLGHEEDPEEFIANQTKTEEKSKKTSKTTTAATKKVTKSSTASTASNVTSAASKSNKENVSSKPANPEQRKQQTATFTESTNQGARPESGRGAGGRGFGRRGGSAGTDRPPYEGGNNRGGGQQRSQRFQKFEGQRPAGEGAGFEQGIDDWAGEGNNDNQGGSGFRGRGGRGGRGRGIYEVRRGGGSYEGGRGGGSYEGGRGGYSYEGGRGRGRGRGGRGQFNNRNAPEGSQQPGAEQESNTWEQSAESNFDNTRPQSSAPAGQDFDADADVLGQDKSYDIEPNRRGGRGGRGGFHARTFRSNRHYGGGDRPNYDREGGSQEDYRQNRRQHDRQPRNFVSTVKPIEKKDGEGAHNWGGLTDVPDEAPMADDAADAATPAAESTSKNWSEQVDEAEKQMTLDEYKKQMEEKKKQQQEKLPQFNRRAPNEGVDPKVWQEPQVVYRKKNDDDDDEEVDEEEGEAEEESEEEEVEEEPVGGKKKVITIPLRFKPLDSSRGTGGPYGSRGGGRRGGRFQDRPGRDEHRQQSDAPNQQPSAPSQQTGDYPSEDRPQSSYRGSRGGGRGEYRRTYSNSARGSRGGQYRSGGDPNAPDIDNTADFPTLGRPT